MIGHALAFEWPFTETAGPYARSARTYSSATRAISAHPVLRRGVSTRDPNQSKQKASSTISDLISRQIQSVYAFFFSFASTLAAGAALDHLLPSFVHSYLRPLPFASSSYKKHVRASIKRCLSLFCSFSLSRTTACGHPVPTDDRLKPIDEKATNRPTDQPVSPSPSIDPPFPSQTILAAWFRPS